MEGKTVHSNDKDVWPSIVNNYATIFDTGSAKYELENCIEITKKTRNLSINDPRHAFRQLPLQNYNLKIKYVCPCKRFVEINAKMKITIK